MHAIAMFGMESTEAIKRGVTNSSWSKYLAINGLKIIVLIIVMILIKNIISKPWDIIIILLILPWEINFDIVIGIAKVHIVTTKVYVGIIKVYKDIPLIPIDLVNNILIIISTYINVYNQSS